MLRSRDALRFDLYGSKRPIILRLQGGNDRERKLHPMMDFVVDSASHDEWQSWQAIKGEWAARPFRARGFGPQPCDLVRIIAYSVLALIAA